MPGAHNGQAALQAKAAGFEALYLSGAAMTASMGIPDLGMITVDEVCFFVRQITRATGIPLLVDGDTGYGEALNVMHLKTPQSAVLSAIIFNALIIIALIPLALRGVQYRPVGASQVLVRNLLIYGLGGIAVPFVGIKLVDMIVNAIGLV